jgi:hypothetical protein
LFGYQALGGSEVGDPRKKHFFKQSVNQLFCDTDGIYSSSEKCDPCIVTGAFYEEPTLGRDKSDDELIKAFDLALSVSKELGYEVFRTILSIEVDPTPDQLI